MRVVCMCVVFFVAGLLPIAAGAQGGPVDDAGAVADAGAAAAAVAPSPVASAPPMATASSSSQPSERPVRGPSVRERAGRRSRGGSAASGALMLTILIGGLAYYVIKRIRR